MLNFSEFQPSFAYKLVAYKKKACNSNMVKPMKETKLYGRNNKIYVVIG